MRDCYDFLVGVRGKFAEVSVEETSVVRLDSDVAAKLKSPAEVNRILREYLAAQRKPAGRA